VKIDEITEGRKAGGASKTKAAKTSCWKGWLHCHTNYSNKNTKSFLKEMNTIPPDDSLHVA